ncbi:MAG: GNAT family N-acetyltransferase [Candidatus Electrothrix sp. GM3_4]|nr:GNAT family N-acetyltransferase [Candidatus Electrothrix sp. GM3_4]
MNIEANLQLKRFSDVNLNDSFFDSLREGYQEFSQWFEKKAEETAYVMQDEQGNIQGFVYLKEENERIEDVEPPLPHDRYLKIGTFKINAHGTKLGERFVKKAFDYSIANGIKKIYVTVFSEHKPLINLFLRYGFKKVAKKISSNGTEDVLLKKIGDAIGDVNLDYPILSLKNKQYLLAIYPDFHTRLFPDSILNNEHASIIDDVSYTNSIEKIYICKMARVQSLMPGDALVVYRTQDRPPAWYRSVATSLCMVEEVKDKSSFDSLTDFLNYTLVRTHIERVQLYEV